MNGYNIKTRLLASSVFAGAAFGLVAIPAVAQEDDAAAAVAQEDDAALAVEQEQEDDESRQTTVTVTGSRIAKQDFVSNSPIATVGAEQFDLTGTVNTEGLLNTLPQTVPGLDRTSNNPGNGTATVDLRGLGASRTLVLVDGRRMVPTSGGGVVDINNIPAALIERVEVVTGGASAVYGSDAIAGVVNFVLKDDFEGVEASAGYEVTEEGDSDTWSAALTMGGNFDNDRGNAVLSLGYTNRAALFQGDRDFAFFAQFDDGEGNLFDGGSSGVPQGAIFGGASFDVDGDGTASAGIFEQDGTLREFITSGDNNDFYNYAPVNYIQLPQERFQMTAKADYDINEDVTVYASALFANNDVPQQLAPTPIFASGSQFSLDGNPFINAGSQQIISDEIGDGVDTDGDGIDDTATVGGFGLRRRLEEVGPRVSDDEFTAFQIQTGISVDLTETWNLDMYFQEGRVKNTTSQLGNVNRDRFDQALLLADADGDGNVDVDAAGNPTCSDASSNGSTTACAPLNLFGEGNISEDAAAFLRTAVVSDADYEVTNFAANIVGDTSGAFELPGGPIGLAFGTEYREEVFAFRPSQDLAAGTIAGFNGAPAVSGSFDVYGIYGEAYLPFLVDAAFADLLALELAYRFEDYSTAGGVEAYKVAGEWLRLNSSVSGLRSIRLFAHRRSRNSSCRNRKASRVQMTHVRRASLATRLFAPSVKRPVSRPRTLVRL